MDERYLLAEMVKCKDEIDHLQAGIMVLEDKYAYLKELYYRSGRTSDFASADLHGLDEKIRTEGFIMGMRF